MNVKRTVLLLAISHLLCVLLGYSLARISQPSTEQPNTRGSTESAPVVETIGCSEKLDESKNTESTFVTETDDMIVETIENDETVPYASQQPSTTQPATESPESVPSTTQPAETEPSAPTTSDVRRDDDEGIPDPIL